MGLKLGTTDIPLIQTTHGTGEWTTAAFLQGLAPSGSITITSNVSAYAFANNKAITSIYMPNSTTMYNYAFSSCTALTTFNAPNTSIIGSYAFSYCTNLTTVILSGTVSIFNEYCFYNCSALNNVIFSGSGTIKGFGTAAFRGCKALSSFAFDRVAGQLTADRVFTDTDIRGVYAPSVTAVGTWGTGAFSNCSNLSYFRTPKAGGVIREATFQNDVALKLVDIKCSTITVGKIFSNCTALETLILRNTSLMTIAGGGSANFTGVSSCNVYVPSSLKSSYESATNWVDLVNSGQLIFNNLEGSPYESIDYVYAGIPAN